jgi:hypothetical protein
VTFQTSNSVSINELNKIYHELTHRESLDSPEHVKDIKSIYAFKSRLGYGRFDEELSKTIERVYQREMNAIIDAIRKFAVPKSSHVLLETIKMAAHYAFVNREFKKVGN